MMKNILILALSTLCIFYSHASSNIYEIELKKPNTDKIEFNKLKGKVLLVVNIATKCGYTPQLDGLEKLYKEYSGQGLVIIGVPSNDFGGQTPENDKDAAKFCRINYGVSFPISQKYIVSGDKKIDLYKTLIKETNNKEVAWNFEKFLIDKKGIIQKRYLSSVKPEDKTLLEDIKSLLK